jgi:sporulation protein YlmC with PRC-barrel domain
MSYLDRDIYGMYRKSDTGPGHRLMGTGTLIGEEVYNDHEEKLGDIKEFMLDTSNGTIAYAVLAFGGFLGLGEKLFAVPWSALRLDAVNKRFLLNIDKDRLEAAPGFDKEDWPDMANQTWVNDIRSFYGSGVEDTLLH